MPLVRIEELSPSNREAAIGLARNAWVRPTEAAYLAWRYGSAAVQQVAALALASDVCVATMFAMRQTYRTPAGIAEALEPFEWHADPAWRPRGAGLRVVKHWCRGRSTSIRWEWDPGQPRFAVPLKTPLRHYGGLAGVWPRLEELFSSFPFEAIREGLPRLGLPLA